MKKIILILFVFANLIAYSQDLKKETTKTTYYLIRHTEKDIINASNKKNPNISKKGIERAKKWAKTFSNIAFDAVYSTNYNRTIQTAKPTADSKKLETLIYDLSTFDLTKFKQETQGKTVLIVGHSNTTPMLTNRFIGTKKYKQIDEKDFTNLYIVTFSNATVSDIHLIID